MPATATLVNGVSTLAFTVPAGARGFLLWNTTANELRLRVNANAAASGADEGIPIAAGDSTKTYFSYTFAEPLRQSVNIFLYHAAGSNITSGVGWDAQNL